MPVVLPRISGVLRRLLMVIGCVVLATAQPMSTFAASAAESPRAPDTVIFPKGSPEAPAVPATRPDSGSGGNLVLALAFLLALGGAWLLFKRRTGGVGGFLANRAERKLQIAETRSLGNRQYLVVAEYEGKKLLLGVTPGQIQLLTELPADGAKK